jgi:tungstate transport system permease protein
VELILQSFSNIFELNNSFKEVVFLSLYVSVLATLISSIVSIYLSSYMTIKNFLGKNIINLIFNSLMSLPPVVVGLILYIIFSSSGVLGFMDLLYSPNIMIIAQFIIITPIIISLSLKSLADRYNLLNDYLTSLNASENKIRRTIVFESRYDLLIIVITGMSRALSEVGAVIIVGGNIDNITRVMTTSIVLETSRGELSLALSLGISLIFIAIMMNLLILYIKNRLL